MEKIIQAISKSLLLKELNRENFFRTSNRSNNELYIIDGKTSPNIMMEIGRLREIAFRNCGGGTGKSVDIDEFDTMDNSYKQLIVWNPKEEAILGGYRYQYGRDVKLDQENQPHLATSHLFHFSHQFNQRVLPLTIELGRSFVSIENQVARDFRKSVYVLDNLWDGLITLMETDSSLRYFFGKVTMYPSYNRDARNLILQFMSKAFPDTEGLMHSKFPVDIEGDSCKVDERFDFLDLKESLRKLNKEVRSHGVNIPPLFNAYMNTCTQMRSFGTAVNHEFGDVEETAILISRDDIPLEKKQRHLIAV